MGRQRGLGGSLGTLPHLQPYCDPFRSGGGPFGHAWGMEAR